MLIEQVQGGSNPRDVILLDQDGGKLHATVAVCKPGEGKKGDKVRLKLLGASVDNSKDKWIKAAKVQSIEK